MASGLGNRLAAKWTEAHIAELRRLIAVKFGSYSQIAGELSAATGRIYTRDSCIGKAYRMSISKPEERQNRPAQRKSQSAKRREKRWAADPSLQQRYERAQAQKETREKMLAGGMSRTAASYRIHLPRLPEMTKSEMRAMLALAVRNTAAMEVHPE